MKAMLLDGSRRSKRRRCDWPRCRCPSRGRARCGFEVRCCAVCRTDLHVIEGDLPRQKMPIIPGHQIVGMVDAARAAAAGGCAARPAGRRRLAAAHLRPVPLLHRRHARTSASRPASPAITPTAATPSTPSCPRTSPTRFPTAFGDVEAAPLLCAGIIGYRALQRSQSAAGRAAGDVRLRLLGPRGDPDRPASRLRGLRGHPRREAPRAGPADGRRLGRRAAPRTCRSRSTARSSSPRPASWCRRPWRSWRRAARWPWPAST